MEEHELRDLIEQVKARGLSRRQFIDSLVTVGLGGPIAIRMLAAAGVASAQPREPAFLPTSRGGGGALKGLMLEAPPNPESPPPPGGEGSPAVRDFFQPPPPLRPPVRARAHPPP